MLEHSKSLLLNIVMYFVGPVKFGRGKWPLAWIIPEAGRIRLLRLQVSIFDFATPALAQTLAVPWQALRTLIVDQQGPATDRGHDVFATLLVAVLSSSQLDHLDIPRVPLVVGDLALVRETLTRLVLHTTYESPFDIVPSIKMLSHLQFLSIRCYFPQEEYTALPGSLHLPSLNSLRLAGQEGSCATFLRMLRVQKVIDVKATFHLYFQSSFHGENDMPDLITTITSFLDGWLPDAPATDEAQIEYIYGVEDFADWRDMYLRIALTSNVTDVQFFFPDRTFENFTFVPDMLDCLANRGARHAIFSTEALPQPAWSVLFWRQVLQSISQPGMKTLHFNVQHRNCPVSLHPLLTVLCDGDMLSCLDALTFEGVTFQEPDLALLNTVLGISPQSREPEKNPRNLEFWGCSGIGKIKGGDSWVVSVVCFDSSFVVMALRFTLQFDRPGETVTA